MKQLKSCPFCGGTAVKGDHEVWCGECFAGTNETSNPTTDWNKRVESKELEQANERIAELEDKLREVSLLRDYAGVDEVINYLLDNTGEIKQLLGDE